MTDCAAASSEGSVLPAPVAATTNPSAPAAWSAAIGVPSVATVAITRNTRAAARSVVTRRRGPRAWSMTTRSPSIRPSDPRFRPRNVSNAEACVFVTSSAASIDPSRTTTAPRSAAAASSDAATRTALARFAGPSYVEALAARIAPVTTMGLGPGCRRSRKNAVSSIVSVPWTTTAPSIAGSARASRTEAAIPNSASNVKWLAGVSPRSIVTRSATASRPGTVSRRAAPPSTGTLPPATGSWRMLIVPPVNTTATRGIEGLSWTGRGRTLGRRPRARTRARDRANPRRR